MARALLPPGKVHGFISRCALGAVVQLLLVSVARGAPPSPVSIIVQGDTPGLKYEIWPESVDASRAAAIDEKSIYRAPPGRFRLRVWGAGRAFEHAVETGVEIQKDSRLLVHPASDATQRWGIALGVAGVALDLIGPMLVVEGMMTSFANAFGCSSRACADGRSGGAVTSGLVMTVVGAAISPLGWILYGTNSEPTVKVERLAMARPVLSLRVGPAPVARGFGLGGWMAF